MDKHTHHSSEREEYVEYILLAQLCAHGWERNRFVEVARTNTDAQGYDLVLSCNGIIRHVQLKASKTAGRTASQKINTALADKPGGCVIWMLVDAETLQPAEFLWFGGAGNQELPDLGEQRAKHTKGNAEGVKALRDAIRVVNKGRFTRLKTMDELFIMLFGEG